jgi:hypothetical protein
MAAWPARPLAGGEIGRSFPGLVAEVLRTKTGVLRRHYAGLRMAEEEIASRRSFTTAACVQDDNKKITGS